MLESVFPPQPFAGDGKEHIGTQCDPELSFLLHSHWPHKTPHVVYSFLYESTLELGCNMPYRLGELSYSTSLTKMTYAPDNIRQFLVGDNGEEHGER